MRKFHGVKSILPLSNLIIGKSQVFSARLYVYLHSAPPPWFKRVNKIRILMGKFGCTQVLTSSYCCSKKFFFKFFWGVGIFCPEV